MSELRQTQNVVEVVGLLKEKNLERKDATIKLADGTTRNTESIGGSVVISTGDRDINVRLYQKALKRDGSPNGIFGGYETILNEYVSEVDVLNKYKDLELPETWKSEVSVVSIKGEIRENAFVAGGNLIVTTQVNTTFLNRVNGGYEPKAEFVMEGFFSKIKEEVVDDEETGRLLIEIIVSAYGGRVFPITLYAPAGEVADYIEANYETGMTGKVWGDLNFTETVEKRLIPAGFGKPKEEILRTSTKELIITGGMEEQYDEDDAKNSLDVGLVKKAMLERASYHEELVTKDKEEPKKGGKPSSGGGNKKATKDDFPF